MSAQAMPAQQRIAPEILEAEDYVLRCLEQAKGDCAAFCERWVCIEDRDQAGIVIPFALWHEQSRTLQTILQHRLVIVLKARQLGLTWLALAYAVWRCLFQPGYSVVLLSKREADAAELVRRVEFILRHLPRWMTRPRKGNPTAKEWPGPTWEATTLSVTIHHLHDEPSTMVGMSSAPDSARSFTSSLVVLDEWAFQDHAERLYSAAYPTIHRETGGQVIGLSTAQRGTLFQRIWDEAVQGNNSFRTVFLPWRADPRRTEQWYQQAKRDLGHEALREYPNTPDEAFTVGPHTAFSEFSRDIHVCKPFDIPAHWTRWRANDPGYTDPFAWYWLAVSEDGIVYVYREYTRLESDPKVTYSDQARQVVRLSVRRDPDTGEDVSENIAFTVCGRDAWNRHPETGKSIVDYYHEGGVYGCIEPPRLERTDRIARKAALHEYLKPYEDENKPAGSMTARLQIFETCYELIRTLPLLQADEREREKVAESYLDHSYDALGYGLVAWHTQKSRPLPPLSPGPIAEHKNRLAKRYVGHMVRRMW